ncbi:MAG: glycoside hydrolase family 78 protein [Chloroflexota bacterium]
MNLRKRERFLVLPLAGALALLQLLLPGPAFAAAPAPPVLRSPADGTTVNTLRPTVSWQPSQGATTYAADISDHPELYGPVTSNWITGLSFTPSVDLNRNTLYYWRVKASSQDGTSDASTVWRFWTKPNLTSPANGAAVTVTPKLVWEQYKTGADSLTRQYRVQIAPDSAFGSIVLDQTIDGAAWGYNSFTVPADALPSGQTYHWRVSVSSADGASGWSDGWSFFAGPPAAPTLTAPGDGTLLDNWRPTLAWSPVTGATSYKVHYVRAGSSARVSGDLTTTSFLLDTFWGGDSTAESSSYEWWVEARNVNGSTSSAHWAFSTPPRTTPPTPELLAPDEGAAVAGLLPVFDWSDTTYTKNYKIQVGTGATAYGITGQLAGPTVTDSRYGYPPADYVTVWPLEYNTTYYWQVTAYSIGYVKSASAVRSFRTPPPPGPSLTAPANGSTLPDGVRRPTLSWSAVTDALTYRVEISANASFSSPLVVQEEVDAASGSSLTMASDLDYDGLYYWRVRFVDASGESDWSEAWSFRGPAPPPPPAAPALLSPPHNTQITVLKPHFDWSDSAGATSYTIELYGDSWRGNLVESAVVAASEYDSGAKLTPGTSYYWQVRAANETSGAGAWSGLNSFRTPPVPSPVKPILTTPENGAVVDTLLPTLDWQDDPNSNTFTISYRVQLAENSGFSGGLAANQVVPGSSFTRASWAPLKKGTSYYWRVQGTNGSVAGEWSDIGNFQTPSVPAVPTLVAPSNGGKVDTTTPTVTLSQVAGATSYTVQVSTASWFPSGTSTITVNGSTSQLMVSTSLKHGTTYYWKARASNAAGNSAFSGYWTFTTPPPPPAPMAPTLLQPGNGAAVGGSRPTLDWNDVPNASKYRVEWSKSAVFQWTEAARDNLTASTFTLDVDLEYNKQYYWRVKATGVGGEGPYSVIYGFQTPSGPPSVATLLSPANGGVADTPLQKFDWADSQSAESYLIQVSTDAGFATAAAVDSSTTASEFTLTSPLVANTTYYWRVAARNGVGDAPWSEGWSFSVPAAPGGVNPVSPANGELVASLRPVLAWDAVTDAAHYEVRYARTTSFGEWVVPTTVDGTGFNMPMALVRDADYSWQVRAVNGGGKGPWSAVWGFHTPLSAAERPTAPNLLEPSDLSTLTTVTPVFSWDVSLGANGYRLQISTDPNFASYLLDSYTSATSVTLSAALDYSTVYYWRVQATNNLGTTNSLSCSFTTPWPPAPPVPTLELPVDGSTTSSLFLSFDWTDEWESKGWTGGYRLQLSTASDFSSFAFNNTVQGVSNLNLPTWVHLSYGTLYYWRVQGYNNSGSGSWSGVASFRTLDPPPVPGRPILVAPGGPEIGTPMVVDSLKPGFSWNGAGGADSYRIQISRNADYSSLMVNATTNATEYALGWQTLAKGTQYWWRVQANNGTGSSSWSTAFTFKAPTVPIAPELVAPTSRSTTGEANPVFDWADVAGATRYQLMVGTNAWFGSKVIDTTVTGTSSFTPTTGLANGSYYWKVNAGNGAGTSGWSPTWSFTVSGGTTPPPGGGLAAPVPVAPGAPEGASAQAFNSLKPVYSWGAVDGATSYRIQVSRNAGFTNLATNTTTGDTSYSAPSWVSLSKATQYWWRVQSIDSAGTSGWSTVYSFVTPSVPAVPILVSPIGGVTAESLAPTLDWEDVAGADSYHLLVGTNPWFGNKVVDTRVTEGSIFTLSSDLTPGATYHWKVSAGNAAGTSNWSTTGSFVAPTP